MPKFSNQEQKTLSSKEAFDNSPWFKIIKDEVLLPSGKKITYSYMKTTGGVIVIPVTEEGEIILVKQYRYIFKRPMTELIMGGNKDLTSLQAAKAELSEEANLQAKTWKKIGSFLPSTGTVDEVIDVYLAKDLSPKEKQEDDTEYIVPVRKKISEVYQMAEEGKIECGETIAALMLAKKHIL